MRLRRVEPLPGDRFAVVVSGQYEALDIRPRDIGLPSPEFRAFIRSVPRPLRHDMGFRGLGWRRAFARQLRRRFVAQFAQPSSEGPR